MSSYRHCQSLVRGLDLLAALNRRPSASAAISDLARTTGMHRTTIKRLLETLSEAGYVACDTETNHYRLTFQVQRLSYGFRDNVQVSEVAWPEMRAISKLVVWPCSLSSLEGDEMVVRLSTRSYSPLSFHPGMPGRRLPLLTTAAGRAYLAFAPPQEQELLCEMIRNGDGPDAELARNPRVVQTLLKQTLNRGYGINRGDWVAEPKFGAVAVPLRYQDRVIACINVIYLNAAVKDQPMVDAIVKTLLKHARVIEKSFECLKGRALAGA